MMNIIKATYEDLPEILDLQYLSYQSEAALVGDYSIQPLTQPLEEVQAEFHKGVVLKAMEEARIVGSIRGYQENGTLYIGKLMVHPDFRRRGIGKKLLQAIEALYPDCRYELFTGSKSVNNIAMYQKQGYREFQRKPWFNDLTFVFMEKNKE